MSGLPHVYEPQFSHLKSSRSSFLLKEAFCEVNGIQHLPRRAQCLPQYIPPSPSGHCMFGHISTRQLSTGECHFLVACHSFPSIMSPLLRTVSLHPPGGLVFTIECYLALRDDFFFHLILEMPVKCEICFFCQIVQLTKF